MKSTQFVFRTFATSLLFAGALAQAATVTGTVTNKTTGKPAAGDTVVLVDVQAGMGEVAHATTDARGHYSLTEPGSGPYLVRVTHQGAGYFIAAPQGGAPGDIPVYDVAAKVQGVFIEADVIEIETDNGQLKVSERYFVHNTSSPPTTQWSKRSFEIVMPEDAVLNDVGAQRPGGLPTNAKLDPDGPKGHFSFNFPIQPDDGDKDTLFQVSYNVPYSSGKYNFKSVITLPADNVAVLLPKSMTFAAGSGAPFKSVQEDPGIQTFLVKNAVPGKTIEFTVSGTGSMPREAQGASSGSQADAGGQPGNQPGGGIGNPINTPDPLSKYKWWILGALALLFSAAAAFLLRKPPTAGVAPATVNASASAAPAAFAGATTYQHVGTPAGKNAALLNALKEELFAVESEKISGTITPEEYAQVKSALEIVLKRALKHSS
ncbi:MAG TPA: carboxypeptidase-like regulatory domain-containing protein [Terracidiphilus sp.]|nr:carboxypeptidase-like regulatory domain-containing protein [Terracidiphilus sp.]